MAKVLCRIRYVYQRVSYGTFFFTDKPTADGSCSFQGARSARGCGIDGAPWNTQGVYGATPQSPIVDTSKYEVNMMDFLSWFRPLFGIFLGGIL